MATDEITKIEVQDKQVRDFLERLTRKLQDTNPLMADIAQQLAYAAESQFAEEKGPDGQAWPDLAESTKKQREKKGKWPGQKLQMTAGGLADDVHTEYGNDYAQIGMTKVYARIHFFGGEAGRGHSVTIPARPYLPVSADGNLAQTTQEDILDIMQNYLNSAQM